MNQTNFNPLQERMTEQQKLIEKRFFESQSSRHAVISGPACGITTAMGIIAMENLINGRNTVCVGHRFNINRLLSDSVFTDEFRERITLIGGEVRDKTTGAKIIQIPHSGLTRDFAERCAGKEHDILIENTLAFVFNEEVRFNVIEQILSYPESRLMTFDKAGYAEGFPDKPHPALQMIKRFNMTPIHLSTYDSPLVTFAGLAAMKHNAAGRQYNVEKYLTGYMF